MSHVKETDDLSASMSQLNIDAASEELRRSTRVKQMTVKARDNAINELSKRKDKILKRVRRKRQAIDELLTSYDNMATVNEELQLLNEMFRMLEDISLGELKIDDEQDDWFDEEDETMCVFKHKVHNWLQIAKSEKEELASQASKRTRSSRSRTSKQSSRSSRSEKAIEDKKRLKELEVSSQFLEKRTEFNALKHKLDIEEEMAKLRARVKIDAEEENKQKSQLKNPTTDENYQANVERNTKDFNIFKLQDASDYVIQESRLKPKVNETWNMSESEMKGLFQPKSEVYEMKPLFPSNHGRDLRSETNKSVQFDVFKPFEKQSLLGAEAPDYNPFLEERSQRRRNNEFINPLLKDVKKKTDERIDVKLCPREKEKEKTQDNQLNKSICELLRLQSAPEVKIEVFKGDPKEFNYFMTIFHEVVEKKIQDQVGRLTRLLEFTEGEPHELIKHCIQHSKDSCYENAKKLLIRQYGNINRIVAAYREEISNIPTIKPNDSASMRKLLIFLLKVDGLQLKTNVNPIDNSDTICRILAKLPVYIQDRWSRNVHQMRRQECREPALKDLISLIEVEMQMCDDPMFSRLAVSKYKERNERNNKVLGRNIKAFVNEVEEKKQDMKLKCNICKKTSHNTEECRSYLQLSPAERSKKIFSSRLCFKCLKPSSAHHTASTCKKPLTCSICGSQHPTTLHECQQQRKYSNREEENEKKNESRKNDDDAKENTVVSAMTRSINNTVSLCVVPIEITHPSSSTVISTMAMLDSCSQGSFLSENLAKKLSVTGRNTSLSVKTINGEKEHHTTVISNLKVRRANDNQWINIGKSYTQEQISVDENDVADFEEIKKWEHLSEVLEEIGQNNNMKVEVLIGANCPKAIEPQKFIKSKNGGPYAVKTRLGWCIVGPITKNTCTKEEKVSINHTSYRENDTEKMFEKMYNSEFVENQSKWNLEEPLSIDDKRFMKIVEEGTTMINSKYHVPLPFKEDEVVISNNRPQAFKRFINLEKKFSKQESFKELYFTAMGEMLTKGYAEEVPKYEDGKTWYLPHHGVTHPEKPNKVRVVFDASAEYNGNCINKMLLKGPDLTNQLLGVLLRFREERIAITADIEGMFFQVRIPPQQRSYFSFLWYKSNHAEKGICNHRMTSHVFGGTSSPSCSNFALRKTAKDNKEKYNSTVTNTLLRNFYVDDLLKSLPEEVDAESFVKDVRNICLEGGFKLTKFTCNKANVLDKLPEDLRKSPKTDNNMLNELPEQSTLGLKWDPSNDTLRFKVNKKEKPMTRRGMLSTLSSIYDPMGLVGPYILAGRIVLQQLCKSNISWDEKIPENYAKEWKTWIQNLNDIENVKLKRCIRPQQTVKAKDTSLHIFSDASDIGYGIACYIRFVNEDNQVNCSLIYGRSRVNPTRYVSIPRMELAAALLAAKSKQLLLQEIDLQLNSIHFWTDSQVVLGYLKNRARQFKPFVANRIQQIQDLTDVSCWHHVNSKSNPADHASRGFTNKQHSKVNQWFQGPEFLMNNAIEYTNNEFDVDEDDKELKNVKLVKTTKLSKSILAEVAERVNVWKRLIRVFAFVLKFVYNALKRVNQDYVDKSKVNHAPKIEELEMSKNHIIKLLQEEVYKEEVQQLKKGNPIQSTSHLAPLRPIIVDNLIRVGGRLSNAELSYNQQHPIILPKNNAITASIVRHYHEKCLHGGRTTTVNALRQDGYWIISSTKQVKDVISKCVTCKRLFAKCEQPLMGDVPLDRTIQSPPFTYVGVDLFGPVYIKERRSCLKRYGVLFTCLCLRSVHIEVANTLSTDSFILSLRRFIGRRGNVKLIRSDNGTNFVGAIKEIEHGFKEMDDEKIRSFLTNKEVEWICWKRNPPYASHMGGVWERQIRSIRRILSVLMYHHKEILNDESLRTFMIEVEATINSRPLTVESINDPDSIPLTPASILTLKSDVVKSLPGVFPEADQYSRKQWRRVQFLANQFWSRWRNEYLTTLQERKKWNKDQRNLEINDVVLIKQNSERNTWPMGKVLEVMKDKHGTVRSVMVKVNTDENENKHEVLHRPVSKLVLLLPNESETPTREPGSQN